MKNILLLSFCFLFSFNVLAQESEAISIQFENKKVEDVLLELEQKTGYKFFYLKRWLPEEPVSGNYENASLESILNSVFQGTVINFYKMDNGRVILTENSVIYDDFSQGFFSEGEEEVRMAEGNEEEESTPLFYETETSGSIETVKIGKEDQSLKKNRFTLTGRITDAKTGRPLSNVSVVFENENIGTVTNEEGYYSINLRPGIHLISTRSMGNAIITKRLVIYNDGNLDFQLTEDLEQLNEVIVESESNKNVKQPFAGVSQLTAQEIKTIPLVLGERDLLKVATTLPGISKAGEGSSGFNIRGGRADQNLILLDDAVLYNPNHFFGIFSALNPFTTGMVDIYKGTIPSKYGGRLSSVFDIQTKEGNAREFSGEGSIGPVTGNLALEIPVVKDKSSLILGGRATYSDWILQNLDEESLKNSQASFYDLIAKYNHRINEDSEINATGYFSDDKFSITSDSLFAYQNRMFSVSYKKELNSDLTGKIAITNSDYKFNIEFDNGFDNNGFVSGFQINDTQLMMDFEHKINNQHSFNYGLSSKFYSLNPGSVDPLGNDFSVQSQRLSEERGLESAVYFSDEFEVSDKFILNAGLRFSVFNSMGPDTVNIYAEDQPRSEASLIDQRQYDDNEFIKTYSGLEYRFTARYFLNDDLSVKGGVSSTYQYIHTLSNNTTVSPTDLYKLSDYNIEPQRAMQYSLGFFQNLNQNEYELSLEGYYKTANDIIDFRTGANLFLNENIEREVLQGEGKSYGVELLLRKNKGDLNGWVGYTYSRSLLRLDSPFQGQQVNGGEYFPSNFDKPHDFSAVLNYKLTKRFSFSGNIVYQTGRPVTYPVGKYNFNNAEFVVYSDRNKYRIPDYYRLDLSFNIEGNHKIEKLAHSFWNISVYNVLGRNNPYSVFFVTNDGEIQAYQSSIFAVPIPTITYNFKF